MNNKGLIVVALFYLLTSFFFTFVKLDFEMMSKVSRVFVALLLIYLFLNWGKIYHKRYCYKSFPFVLYFLLAPIITHISCFLSHGQSIIASISVATESMVLAIYFYCILKGTNKDSIITFILLLAVARTLITLIEQFTYPHILFSFAQDFFDDYGSFHEVEERSGFRRFNIADAYYLVVFLGFYSFNKIIKRFQMKYALVFLFALLGIYMDQSRQIMFVFFISLLFTPFLMDKTKSNNKGLKVVLIIMIFSITLYANYDSLFGELGEKTSEQLNADYTRSVEIVFFLSKLGNPLTILFGNGWFGNSAYGREYIDLQDTVHMYRSDVGIVGALHMLGAVFIIVFIVYYITVVRKNWRYISMEYKYMLLFILFDIPLIFPIYNFTFASVECFMGILFYLIDKSIQENKKVLNYKV